MGWGCGGLGLGLVGARGGGCSWAPTRAQHPSQSASKPTHSPTHPAAHPLHPRAQVRSLIHQLLVSVGRHHPQALMYPLLVACKSASPSRRAAAYSVLEALRQHSAVLVEQAQLVSTELIRWVGAAGRLGTAGSSGLAGWLG